MAVLNLLFWFIQMLSPASSSSQGLRVRGPSDELQELLQRLGVLSQQHDQLVRRVSELEVSKLYMYFKCRF